MKQSEYQRDRYAKQARIDGASSRSYYKLKELNERYKFLHPNQRIVDLGAHPGGWTQYMSHTTAGRISVTALDREPISPNVPLTQYTFLRLDFLEKSISDLSTILMNASGGAVDGVLSDLAPQTTGIRDRDAANSYILAERALLCAQKILQPNGFFIAKVFAHDELSVLIAQGEAFFKRFRLVRLKSTRQASREVFMLGEKFHSPHPPPK